MWLQLLVTKLFPKTLATDYEVVLELFYTLKRDVIWLVNSPFPWDVSLSDRKTFDHHKCQSLNSTCPKMKKNPNIL